MAEPRVMQTEEWRLRAYLEWVPLKEPFSIQCPSCRGRGEVGGGFKDIDGPRECPQCYGARSIIQYKPTEPMPEISPELVEHMRKAWKEYFKDIDVIP